MPKQGLQMTEGVITRWLVHEGEEIREGQPFFEMETDKLSITIDASASGTVLKLLYQEGDAVPVAQTIAYIGPAGMDMDAVLQSAPVREAPKGGRVFASPYALSQSGNARLDIARIAGTGPDGLVIERDVIAACPEPAPLEEKTPVPLAQTGRETVIPLRGRRKIIAERMHSSLQNMAQANHRMEVDMAECVCARERLKALGVKLSFNDIVIRCVAKALREFPMMNASMTEDSIIQKHYVNVGMAVATEDGILVPVIRDADKLSLVEIAKRARDLSQRTREGTLDPDELSGGTFTVTNLGMYGVDSFTAIINAPEAGILAVGQIKKRPVVLQMTAWPCVP